MGEHVQLFDILSGKTAPVAAVIGPDALRAAWSASIDECVQLYRVYDQLKRYDMPPSEYCALLRNPSHHGHFALAQTNELEITIFKSLLPDLHRGFESALSKSLAQADKYPELWTSDAWQPLLDNLKRYVHKRMGLPLTKGCMDGLSAEPRANAFHEMLGRMPELMPPERLRIFRQVASDFVKHGKQMTSFQDMEMGYTIRQLPYRLGLTDLQNRLATHNIYKLKTSPI